jgi:hypothetical protein
MDQELTDLKDLTEDELAPPAPARDDSSWNWQEDDDDALDQVQFGAGADRPIDPLADPPFEVGFLTGSAGTGKTYEIKRRITADPGYAWLCATTGIAAVNLGAATINSLLKYFDTASMEQAFMRRSLHRALLKLAAKRRLIALDEVSMMPAEQLDMLYRALWYVNEYLGPGSLGLVLTGDFLQLPPVNAKWAFMADCWPQFDKQTTVLDKVWRQTDETFMKAMAFARRGQGQEAVMALRACGVEFTLNMDNEFGGTTIISKNKKVDAFNDLRLSKLPGQAIAVKNDFWGRQGGEVKNNIPQRLVLKPGALVMILANSLPDYANGDLAEVVGWDDDLGRFVVRVLRTGKEWPIGHITRLAKKTDPPHFKAKSSRYPQWMSEVPQTYADGNTYMVGNPEPCPWDPPAGGVYVPNDGLYVHGAARYVPLRLAWASTVHKSQGLSLDKVQLDPRDGFFGSPGMAYVAMSRARSPEGLRVVGNPELLAGRINMDPRVERWA